MFIWLGVGVGILELLVVDDAARIQIDQEHLARLQTPLLDDFGFRDRQYAGFRRHHHQVVIGHNIARRAQAIAVERAADVAAIGEGHRCRAIPRLHHRGMIFIEGAAVGIHQSMIFPGFRDHHHHCLGNRITGHQQ